MLDSKDRLTHTKEQIIARYIGRILGDLRLIDIADYIDYAHDNKLANIEDIIEAATELHFITNSIQFAKRATYSVNWNEPPTITFYMLFKYKGVAAKFRLTLSAHLFSIQLDEINFVELKQNNETVTDQQLTAAFEAALLNKQKLQH